MFKESPGKNKVVILITLALLLCLAAVCVIYVLNGQRFIKAIYEGRSIGILNSTIRGQNANALEYYCAMADAIFIICFILSFTFIIVFAILKLFTRWNLLDILIVNLSLSSLLFSAGSALKIILDGAFSPFAAKRLAWTFSLFNGYQMYYGCGSGPVVGRMYGPFTPLVYIPATLASSPIAALIFGSCLSACFYFLPILWLHFNNDPLNSASPRKSLFALCGFSWFCLLTFNSDVLSRSASMIHADAPMLGMCAIACAFMLYRERKGRIPFLFLSALFSVFAVWTKQTAAPILLALPTYILMTDGYRCFKRYVLQLAISGIMVSAIFLWIIGPQDLFFNMFAIPSRHPWARTLFRGTVDLVKESSLVITILLAMTIYSVYQSLHSKNNYNKFKTWLRNNPWLILATVGLFMMPVAVLGSVKAGGTLKSLSLTLYFFTSAATLAQTKHFSNLMHPHTKRTIKISKLLLILLIAGLICSNVPKFRQITVKLYDLPKHKETVAYTYAKNHPGETYFPWNPLAIFMAEGKFYHFMEAIGEIELAGFEISDKHIRAYTPAGMRFIAFPADCKEKPTMKYFPEFSKRVYIDELSGWVVYGKEF